MNHEDYKEMLALDALGLLEEADAGALREHLEGCAQCRAEADEMRGVAAMLAYTAPPVAPDGELRGRILGSIHSVNSADGVTSASRPGDAAASVANASQTGSANAAGEGGAAASPDDAATPLPAAHAPAKVLPFAGRGEGRPGFFGRPAYAFGAIAASLVIAVLAVSLFMLWQQNEEMRAEIRRLSTRADEMTARAGEMQSELSREREEREILAAPGTRMTTLAGTESAPAAHAMLAYDRRTGRALLLASDLPPAPAGKAYQLWFIAGGRPLPGKVFTTDAGGRATLRDQIPPEGSNATIFAVTLEPAQGVSAPTGDKFLVGNAS